MTLLDLSTSFKKQQRQRMNLNGSTSFIIMGARSFAKIIQEYEKKCVFLAFVGQLLNALFYSMKSIYLSVSKICPLILVLCFKKYTNLSLRNRLKFHSFLKYNTY